MQLLGSSSPQSPPKQQNYNDKHNRNASRNSRVYHCHLIFLNILLKDCHLRIKAKLFCRARRKRTVTASLIDLYIPRPTKLLTRHSCCSFLFPLSDHIKYLLFVEDANSEVCEWSRKKNSSYSKESEKLRLFLSVPFHALNKILIWIFEWKSQIITQSL